MLRAVVFVGVLGLFPTIAAAQQPCTTDARRVVDEVYRRVLERPAGAFASGWSDRLANGQSTVRDVVREVAKSSEHMQRFLSGAREQSATYLYRHLLAREPDPDGLRAHSEGIRTAGAASAIDSMINSAEYQQKFGDDTVPGSQVRYCGPNQESQTSSSIEDTRFRGMDRDGNGTISRDEWRGSAQAFRNHDWNRDGVLSGDEIRNAARSQDALGNDDDDEIVTQRREERFDNLDTNGDGRITRNEWRGTDERFDQLDRNGNGVLSRNELVYRRANVDRFSSLDVNGDGRLSLNEWQGTRRAFYQLDDNDDGVLSRFEFNNSGAVSTTGR